MTERVAWMSFRSLHGTGRVTKVHLTENGLSTLCGILVPMQARPGRRGGSIFQRVFRVDVDRPQEWGVDDPAAIPQCQRCRSICTCMKEDGAVVTPSGSCPVHEWMVDA